MATSRAGVGADDKDEVTMQDWSLLRCDLDIRLPTSDTAPLHNFGRWDDQPHQHLPAARLSASPWRGLLIADEVGLGKTISAIRVLRRLHAIGRTGAVIITCPGGLRSKWRQELYHRADLDCAIADSGRRLLAEIQRMREGEPRIIIVSHGVLRRSQTLEQMLDLVPNLMLTIVDEAHHCRNPRSRLHDAVQLLSMRSEEVLLLTATPINLRDEELWVQLSLLAPDRWPTLMQFQRTMGPTRMLNDALAQLSLAQPDLPGVLDRLRALDQTVGIRGDPRLDQALDLVLDEGAWNAEQLEDSRQHLADLIRVLRPLNDLLVRTRRRDLDWNLTTRRAITLDIMLTEEEWRLYEAARRWSRTLVQMRHPEGRVFDWALIVPERMASSCLPAFATHVLRQLRTAAREALDFDLEDDDGGPVEIDEVEMRVLRRLGNLRELVAAAEKLGEIDTKYEALREWVSASLAEDEVGGILLFSHFHASLNHLRTRLRADGFSCEVLTGRTPMAARDILRESFKAGEFDILLSSEVGSEGLDQQHCHRLVNYDLPWNPMRIEQRIGRLDRFGQKAEEIVILNLAVEGTIDAAILHRLYHRIRLFEDSLGMLDPMLGQAMRMVARAELDRPSVRGEHQAGWGLVPAETADAAEQDPEMRTLLNKRENWMSERAIEEREWLGPDPGISSLRTMVESHGLGLDCNHLRRWVMYRLAMHEGDAQLHPTGKDDVWMLRLDDAHVAELAARCEDPMLIDATNVGWLESITRMATGSGPHWLHVVFEREVSRQHPELTLLAPWHPLIRWLCEPVDENDDAGAIRWLYSQRGDGMPEQAKWLVAIDWTVYGLRSTCIRRWLLLDENGSPLPTQDDALWRLVSAVDSHSPSSDNEELIEKALDVLHNCLLSDERRRQTPLIEELRANAEQAWDSRIRREMNQLSDAEHRAQFEGTQPDERWVRMKEGLISRLQDELANRLRDLDRISECLNAEINARIVVKLD
jgi:superfamily II DNA or RNA helicase